MFSLFLMGLTCLIIIFLCMGTGTLVVKILYRGSVKVRAQRTFNMFETRRLRKNKNKLKQEITNLGKETK